MSTLVQPGLTADDLLALPDAERFELVNGQLVERHMSLDSSWVAGEVHRRLANYAVETGNGWAFPDGTSFQCFADDGERVRRPDASYIAREHLANGPVGAGHCRVAPDLAVEVVSPGDLYYDVEEKTEEYLEAGVQQVWVISPHSQSMVIYRQTHPPVFLEADAELTGGDLLPGFHCRVAELFPASDGIRTTGQRAS